MRCQEQGKISREFLVFGNAFFYFGAALCSKDLKYMPQKIEGKVWVNNNYYWSS